VEDGFNGKLTEIHAALGLANLKYYDAVLNDRKAKYLLYKEKLQQVPTIRFQDIAAGETNYSYFPIIFETEAQLLDIESVLKVNAIVPRRYFYPSVNTYTKVVSYQPCPISEDISKRILCLPLYFDLSEDEILKIIALIVNC
jgi:dTDP-4-amino-4,6-dideoxygalactose transaminase